MSYFMKKSHVRAMGEYARDGVEGYANANDNHSRDDVRGMKDWAESRMSQEGWQGVAFAMMVQAQNVERAVNEASRGNVRAVK